MNRNESQHHWTAESDEAFVHKIAFDFIAQIEQRLEATPVKQSELAHRLGVSEGAVSKLLNNPQNLTLKTIAKYARALGMKAAIVAYDDDDPGNNRGLINSQIFTTCWERAGKPRDVWALDATQVQKAATATCVFVYVRESAGTLWNQDSTNLWNTPFVRRQLLTHGTYYPVPMLPKAPM